MFTEIEKFGLISSVLIIVSHFFLGQRHSPSVSSTPSFGGNNEQNNVSFGNTWLYFQGDRGEGVAGSQKNHTILALCGSNLPALLELVKIHNTC